VPGGSLVVVGTGIRAGVQLTPEARSAIESADRVFFLVAEPVAAEAIARLNPAAESLHELYEPGLERRLVYEAMVERVLAPVRSGLSVCAAFYGHAGVFGTTAHEAVRQASREGFTAEMLPGVSALDCLIADLGVDPGVHGCQCYEATSFLWHRPPVDTDALLVLWQVSAVGRTDSITKAELAELPVLVGRLLELYPADREVVCYEASPFPVGRPYIRRVPLSELATEALPPLATIVICPPDQAADVPSQAHSSSDRAPAAPTTLPLAE
jgi:uncharacterized protein YabN with tetrapyrrole methylase and pyrophosphatase domain